MLRVFTNYYLLRVINVTYIVRLPQNI